MKKFIIIALCILLGFAIFIALAFYTGLFKINKEEFNQSREDKNLEDSFIEQNSIVYNYNNGDKIETGKIYKLFELDFSPEMLYLSGGDIIENYYFTKCDPDYKNMKCASINLDNLNVEYFGYADYINIIKNIIKNTNSNYNWGEIERTNKVVSTVFKFIREEAKNYITEAGIRVNPPISLPTKNGEISQIQKVDYRTQNFDYKIDCRPLGMLKTEGMHCVLVHKRSGVFDDQDFFRTIITKYQQPKNIAFLENALIWSIYNENTGKNEYYYYLLEK